MATVLMARTSKAGCKPALRWGAASRCAPAGRIVRRLNPARGGAGGFRNGAPGGGVPGWQPRRCFGWMMRGMSGMIQKGLSLSQMRVNQAFCVLSVTVPRPMIWMVASETL